MKYTVPCTSCMDTFWNIQFIWWTCFFYKSGKHYIITSISSYQQVCLRWSQAQNKSTDFEIVKQKQLNSKETFLDTPCEGTVCNTDFLVVYTWSRKKFCHHRVFKYFILNYAYRAGSGIVLVFLLNSDIHLVFQSLHGRRLSQFLCWSPIVKLKNDQYYSTEIHIKYFLLQNCNIIKYAELVNRLSS